jgi:hypothetical protein
MSKKTPQVVGQFALSERDDLLSTIAEQARENSRLAGIAQALQEEVSRLNASRVPEGWTLAADQVPQTGKAVLAHYTNSHGMGRRIRAEYIAAWTVQAEDVSDPDNECVKYSKQDDAYYLIDGWYELIDNWDEHGRISVTEGVITHWMPLPAAPAPTLTSRLADHVVAPSFGSGTAPTDEPAHSDVKVPRELLRFLLGESELHGVAFGDARPPLGKFWWRTELRAMVAGGDL